MDNINTQINEISENSADDQDRVLIEDITQQIKIRKDKLLNLQSCGENPFESTSYNVTEYSNEIKEEYESFEGKEVSVAGRIMNFRDMGKASFLNIADTKGSIQIYARVDNLGDEFYKKFIKFDIGDIVGVYGEVFKTKKGEISIKASKIVLLSKSLIPLPEKFHGLKDTDLRYRQRYLDLIMNHDVKETFVKRSLIIKEIRKYLDLIGFLEVETPVLHSIAGGAAARPFKTYHNTLDLNMNLRIALELHLKRLIVGGFDKVYEIGRVFRNEGISVRHNPEFTLLELYEAYSDYEDMMNLTENLIKHVASKVLGTLDVEYSGVKINFGKPFERLSMVDAVKIHSGVDFSEIKDLKGARETATEHNIDFEDHHLKGDILNLFFERYVEEKLIQPTFIVDYPVEISPLAKRKKDDRDYTERFELFIVAREHANAFSELNDPIDQRERFKRQVELKSMGDEEANDVDEDFLNSLEYGLPPTGGLGIGIDRLVMLFTNSSSIRDVLLFPTMKPKG